MMLNPQTLPKAIAASLLSYAYWIGRNAASVRAEVIALGGWKNVFPQSVPPWASRVRNYFNEMPIELRALDEEEAQKAALAANKSRLFVDWKARVALDGSVYEERRNLRLWYLMHKAGRVHHTPGKPTTAKVLHAASMPAFRSQVFKLISPDGTGGSSEVCIDNPQSGPLGILGGRKEAAKSSSYTNIVDGIIAVAPAFRGTYNYSETIVMGFPAHNRRDILPHVPGDYLDIDMATPLERRIFPEKDLNGRDVVRECMTSTP